MDMKTGSQFEVHLKIKRHFFVKIRYVFRYAFRYTIGSFFEVDLVITKVTLKSSLAG